MWWWPDLDRGWPTAHDPVVAQAGAGGSSCVPVSKAPLLRRAGLSGCIKPVRLGVMIMVASSKDHGLMRQTSWDHTQLSSDLLQVEVLEWRTPPCTVGDSERLAPRMRSAGVAAWMRGKGHSKSTWWCAQRGHLQGVQRLVNTVPGADYYLLVDDDTQVFPRATGLLLTLLERRILQPHEDLYTGHLIHPEFVALHPESPLKVKPFIGTGGGALLRGSTLRRLQVSGTLDAFITRQTEGDLRWSVLDWTFGLAMAAMNLTPRGHAAFQQFAGQHGVHKKCNASWVSCHEYERLHFRERVPRPKKRSGISDRISGLERCSERQDLDLPGHDLPVQCVGAPPHFPCAAPSAAACRERCEARCRCFAYVYAPEGQCYLKGRSAAEGAWWPKAGFRSGRCDDAEPQCEQADANVRAHELAFQNEAMHESFDLLRWAMPCRYGDFGMPSASHQQQGFENPLSMYTSRCS